MNPNSEIGLGRLVAAFALPLRAARTGGAGFHLRLRTGGET